MFSRKYSLKGRYNFKKILRFGDTYTSLSFILKFKKDDDDEKRFAIIASNKFSKSAVVQNGVKRLIGNVIEEKVDKFPSSYSYIFIPKKSILDKDGKINRSAEEINIEIDTFLSKMAVL